MSKQVSIFIVSMFVFSLIFAGCAKKKINVSEQTVTPTSQMNTTPLKQEDLTKESDNIKSSSLSNGNVEEYSVSSQQLGSETTESKTKISYIPEKDLMELKKRIHFAFDSYELNKEAKDILKKKAEILLKYPSIKMIIEGHCDERGTEEYNLALGERRARAAYEYLILLGIEADRLKIISYGEERPLDPRHNEEAWAKNRRDEFEIVKSQLERF